MAGDVIDPADVPLDIRTPQPIGSNRLSFEVGTSLQESEKAIILATLAHHDGNKREAAKVLGVSLKTLYNRLKDYAADGERPARRTAPTSS
jgi:two-component system, NtrC family, response regulator HydG